jgi:hypothetical protein
VNRLVQQLGLVLLICFGVQITAELLRPAMPLLVTLAVLVGIAWLVKGAGSRGFR